MELAGKRAGERAGVRAGVRAGGACAGGTCAATYFHQEGSTLIARASVPTMPARCLHTAGSLRSSPFVCSLLIARTEHGWEYYGSIDARHAEALPARSLQARFSGRWRGRCVIDHRLVGFGRRGRR